MFTEDICGEAGKRSAVPLTLNSIGVQRLRNFKKGKQNADVGRNKSLNNFLNWQINGKGVLWKVRLETA